jgi:hypothetical protein
MKGDFGSLDFDYSNYSSLLSSSLLSSPPAKEDTTDLATSMPPRKAMDHTRPSPIKSGSKGEGMYGDMGSPPSERQCFQLVLSLQEQLKVCKADMAKQQARHDRGLHDALQRLSEVTKEKQKWQKRLEDTEAKLRGCNTTNKLDVSLPIKKDLKELLESQAKSILWGMVKFIQSPEEEMMAAKMLIKCAENLPEEHVASKEDRDALANTYKTYIRKAIFQRRNYVAAEHKKVMVKCFKDKGSMPTVSQLLKCLRRDITSDEDYDIFEFYWEELLPKQVGSCAWSKDIRNYTTICDAIRKEVTRKPMPMITSEDEAFTVLVVKNSYGRWMKEIQEKDGAPQKEDARKKRPNYNGLYTTTDSGQNEWGGWTQEGLEIFNSYVDINRAARKGKNCRDVEKVCLARIKQKYNIVCNDHKTQTDLNKKRKRKGGDDGEGEFKKQKPLLTIRPEFHNIFSDEEDNATDDDEGDAPGSLASPTQSKSKCLPPQTIVPTHQCSTPMLNKSASPSWT